MTNTFLPPNGGYLKQVIVCRKDLCMPTGKVAAMVAHAAMTFIIKAFKTKAFWPGEWENAFSRDQERWLTELDPGLEHLEQESMAKIVLAVSSEQALLCIEQKAREAGLECHRVVDSGHSHNKPNTLVAIAIGPDWPERLWPITGHLKVYR